MIQSPLAVATDGYICNSPSFPLSVWTRGLLCLILIIDDGPVPGSGSSYKKLWPRFGDYKYTKRDLEEMHKAAKQIAKDDEEMVTIMMLSMIYGLLD